MTQPDEVWLCEGSDLLCENLAAKDDLTWRAKDEKPDAPQRQWMSEPLEQCKGMVGQSEVGKLFAYVMAGCWEAGVWPPGLREFDLVFDVPGTPDTILLKDVKRHVKTVLMGHFD